MPPLASKGKAKGRDRRSRSRNTTPNSVISSAAVVTAPAVTAFLGIDISNLLIPPGPQYAQMAEKLELKQDPKQLDILVEQLKQLSESAETRSQTCHVAMTSLSEKLKEIAEQERERVRQEREAESRRARIKKEAEMTDEDVIARKTGKRSKRKDRSSFQNERPLAHGAHQIARQDRMDLKVDIDSSALDHPSPAKKARLSPGSSPLSDVAATPEASGANDKASPGKISSSSSEDGRQPQPAPPVTQHAYFPDPLAPDPVNYEIQEVTPDMTDEEKKRIYSVAAFPTKDLSNEIAGTPPDKDFSNAKPTNQTAASTFLTYAEPYLRQLTEEDIAFLRERGDRVTSFIIPSRAKKHYRQVWNEEDNATQTAMENASNNRASGTIEDVSDDTINTDRVSGGPLAHRLLSLLRFEHRNTPAENSGPNGTTNGTNDPSNPFGDNMDLDSLGHIDSDSKPLPPSAYVAEQHAPKNANSASDAGILLAEDRIKDELRHAGLLGMDENPDFDTQADDPVTERLRLLQAQLKPCSIRVGARKGILFDKAKEKLALQEYKTIHEDLDNQVQQTYLKRTRTLGKSKKGHQAAGAGRPRANGVAGATAGGAAGAGLARHRDIGDSARLLMDRRRRWATLIGPIFEDISLGVPKGVGKGGKSIFEAGVIEKYEQIDREVLEEDLGEAGL